MFVKTKENLYATTAVIAWRFSLVITKVHNTEDTGLIPVQRMLELFHVSIVLRNSHSSPVLLPHTGNVHRLTKQVGAEGIQRE